MPEIPRLFLIDGNSYIYRAFYAIGQLSTSIGFPTNAIFGFTSMLLKVLREMKPEYVAVVFDAKGPTFRDEIYSDYKANRPGMPEGLEHQIPYIKRITEAYSIPVIEKEGYEADDIIGTIAKETAKKGVDVVIVTGDKDMLQLVGQHVVMYDPMKKVEINLHNFDTHSKMKQATFMVEKCFAGDKSDNVPGIHGFGPVKVKKYLAGEIELNDEQKAQLKLNEEVFRLDMYKDVEGEVDIYEGTRLPRRAAGQGGARGGPAHRDLARGRAPLLHARVRGGAWGVDTLPLALVGARGVHPVGPGQGEGRTGRARAPGQQGGLCE